MLFVGDKKLSILAGAQEWEVSRIRKSGKSIAVCASAIVIDQLDLALANGLANGHISCSIYTRHKQHSAQYKPSRLSDINIFLSVPVGSIAD